MKTTTGADGKSKVYAYDSAGRVTQEYATAGGSPADQRQYYYHGTTGQLTKVTYDGTYSANLYYDVSNRLTKLTDWIDAANGLRYTYDSAGRAVTLTDYDNRTLIYGYDANGRATTMTDWHGNTTAYSYTALGQVSTVTAPGSKVWDYDYNALGQPTKVTCPNTMTTEYAYDGTNRMTKIAYMDGATTVDSFTYGLTPASQITKITHADGSYWDYGNDARGRLTTAVRKDAGNNTQTSHAYVYDAGDNMLSKTVDGTLTTFAYTSGNELTTQTVGGTSTSMYYDVAGRMISKAQGAYSATYDWRYDGKLYAVTSNFPNEGTVNYEYRGDGKRHSRLAGGSTARYNWDAQWNEVSEGDGSNNLQTTFTIDNPAARVAGTLAEIAGSNPGTGTAKYYLKDHLGSTRRVHAADKSTLATTEFQPYGETYATCGTPPTFSFTGKPYDATSAMYYFPYRFYSPSITRWVSRDPLGHLAQPNRYCYVGAWPVLDVDSDGRISLRLLQRRWDSVTASFYASPGQVLDLLAKTAAEDFLGMLVDVRSFYFEVVDAQAMWMKALRDAYRAVEMAEAELAELQEVRGGWHAIRRAKKDLELAMSTRDVILPHKIRATALIKSKLIDILAQLN